MSKTTLSTSATINALLSLYEWSPAVGVAATLSYSFPTTGSPWIPNYGPEVSTTVNGVTTVQWSPLNTAQQANFISALSSWSDVANLTFNQVADNTTGTGTIRVAFSNYVSAIGAAGLTFPPPLISDVHAGDVWLNPNDTDFSPGTLAYQTMQHEIGHALGLKHLNEAVSGNSATLTVDNTQQYSTMSYVAYAGAGSFGTYNVLPSTPMLYDVAAIQFLYGANMTTRTGNDVYTFSNSQGVLKTIWDAGGIDTFDLSNQTFSQTINLNAGQFSSLGVQQTPSGIPLTNGVANVAIAYNVSIENAIGGAGDDTLTGNLLNNTLTGGAGNDTITGDAGNDKLDGGLGNDNLSGGVGNDTYVVDAVGDIVTEAASAGTDTVQSSITWTLGANLENLTLLGSLAINGTGNTAANTITGNAGKNTLNGSAGNDKLSGGAGADTLIGAAGNDKLIGGSGADILSGGAGQDIFLFDSMSGIDKINDFTVIDDTIQIENAVFTAFTVTGVVAADQFIFGSLALDNNDHLIYNQSNGALYYDIDGNGAALQTQIATLGVNLLLTNADFVVV